ncbi:MAG: hypothetical protein ABR587_17280, partial [Candidatus Binatia bacterium]
MRRRRELTFAVAAAVVFAAALAFYQSFADYGFHREDEGALLLQFWRWSTGETPYRDFHMGYTPGVYFVHKTLMQWFGPGLLPGRLVLGLVHSVSALLLFVLASRLTRSWKWALIAPLLYIAAVPVHGGGFAAFNIPYPTWYCLMLFALSAVLLPSIAERPTAVLLVVCGVLAGAGFTFKPNVGLFQLAASALVCLLGLGRPRAPAQQMLWWAWWTAILGGLLVVFATTPSAIQLAVFLAPVLVAAVAVARDAWSRPARDDDISVLLAGFAMSAGFLAVCIPWLAWSYSILGPDWFARRALFFGAGFESVYYLSAPSPTLGLVALLVGVAVWLLPSRLERVGLPAWMFPIGGCLVSAAAFAALAATQPMPEGLYAAVMRVVEPGFFAAATFVQWAMLLIWLGRPAARSAAADRVLATTTICGVMLYLQIFPRTDLMHWVAAAPLLFPCACWLMQSLADRWSRGRTVTQRRAVAVAVALPIVALALLRVGHFFDARWDLEAGRVVRTPETRLRIPHAPLSINAGRADEFRDLEQTVDYVTSHSTQDQTVFTFPALDYVSYFSLRKPGNRHGYYFPGWPGHETEAEVLSFVGARPPTLVVTIYEHQLYFSAAPTYYLLFADYFEPRYHRVARRGPYAILALRADAPLRTEDAPHGLSRPAEAMAIADAVGAARMSLLQQMLTDDDARVRIDG